MWPFFPSLGTPGAACRKRRLLLLVLLTTLAGCASGGTSTAASTDAGDGRLSVGPTVLEDTPGTTTTIGPTTTTKATSTTTEPEAIPLLRAHIAPDGSDARSGDGLTNAVASVERALSVLAPGGTVVFEPGVYPPLDLSNLAGTLERPLRFEASGSVEIQDVDYRSGAGILIRDSAHLEVVGIRVRQSLWGVYIERSHGVVIDSLDIADIGQEGIRVKGGSTNIRLESNTVTDTGRRTDTDANGEGIYLGTGSPGGVDAVSDIVVINNTIARTTDEAIDVKRPATNIQIVGNTISDIVTQTSGAIVVHLNGDQSGEPNIIIDGNVIRNVTRSSTFRDGNCIVSQVAVRIVNNVLHNCQHRGIYLRGNAGTATLLHNTFINAGELGAVSNEGRGMRVVSENNLGIGGDANREATNETYVNATDFDYRIRNEAAVALMSAPNKDVPSDLFGTPRPSEGPVTFGAIEATPAG